MLAGLVPALLSPLVLATLNFVSVEEDHRSLPIQYERQLPKKQVFLPAF
jgi:hypothetical protein